MDLIVDFENELARGSERHVYRLSNSDGYLAKIIKYKHLRAASNVELGKFSGWLKLRRAYGLFRREQRAYTDAMLRAAVRGQEPPLAGICGFILTERGLAQLVEHVRSPDGTTAPSLADILEQGPLPSEQLDALNRFASALYEWHIPAYDLGPKNILWQSAKARFVLVDGFGDRAAIPLVTWFRAANDWALDRAFEKTERRSSLRWDRSKRLFSNGPTTGPKT